MQTTLIQQGLDLMFVGMGTVFVFLAVLVVGTVAMSKLVLKFLPVEAEKPSVKPFGAGVASASSQPLDAKTLAILQDAVNQHRAR